MKALLLTIGVCLGTFRFATAADSGYVAHEWGTFTSVQGADGVQMAWNPLSISELPKFVYDRNRRPGVKPGTKIVAAKTGLVCTQRMETPVIYFYSAQPRTVDVDVRFPSGTITEWYPREAPLEKGIKGGALHWADVQILPLSSVAKPDLPLEKSGSHYYAARETDADFVRVIADKAAETEKFLFYRGVGNFDAPLKVTVPGPDATELTLQNTGAEELRDLFICDVRQSSGNAATPPVVSFQYFDKLPAGDSQTPKLIASEPGENQREQLAAELRNALARAGLFVPEAAAMVQTWADSWLGEPGVRVLYVLPRAWTDSTLPLALKPAPSETIRVMVGRAEVITPPMERALAKEIERFHSSDEAVRATAVGNVRSLGLGRFLEAALRRFAAQHPKDRELSNAGWELLQLASAPPQPLVSSTR